MLRISTLVFAAAMLAQPAQAGVMYSWKQTEASDQMPVGLNLQLTFSDAAIARGKVSLDFTNRCFGDDCEIDAQSDLLALRYWHQGQSGPGAEISLIDFRHRDRPRYYHDWIKIDIEFLSNGMLSGSIFANDGNSDFHMESSGSTFTMVAAHSDEYLYCGIVVPVCTGERGELRAEIPEPSSVAISGLGLLAAWFARRRRR